MANVDIKELRKNYGALDVIKGINLSIREKEFTCFLGPSGCGKSTLLRMIAGLEDIDEGTLAIGNKVMNDVPAAKRNISMVFQSYALYPHMTVRQNMEFGLKLLKLPKEEIELRISETAQILQLTPYLDRLPKQLSGGQRQRVAIGRAIVKRPQVFLLDEPLSNLDAALRVSMRVELARLHEELDATMIYVTHDQIEAMTLADRVVVMRDGQIEQVGTPLELLHSPKNLFVAQFIGSPKINSFDVEVVGNHGTQVTVTGQAFSKPLTVEMANAANLSSGTRLTLCLRPHRLRNDTNLEHQITGTVQLIERLGSESLIHLDIGLPDPVISSSEGTAPVRRGDQISLRFSAQNCLLFDTQGAALPRKLPADAQALMGTDAQHVA
ncbi:ABC transporter ATP-binding protein [Maritalea porphyrae]|uniref:ABC transporter ATP-binding protein n=1 Tax=Maritalea porphyrae TaxID=880732 RepID=UPI0022AF2FB6|nr:ABC transporter ATP-binding protein [Maritalea porphyrae]MCZ4272482.1 ABC transporter ATP-binding protein [Maritalea porphyrae]